MRYLLLIYGDQAEHAKLAQEKLGAEYEAYMAFGEEVRQRGVHIDNNALMPISTATTVRVRAGKTLIADGPFAETKEQLGGYYLLNCKDLDEAIEFAAKIPAAIDGSIEIRPIMELDYYRTLVGKGE
ncbi:YciI family protein [Ktedonosporobacter rubrisoli]|uniref:YciI family protein n=1 Tax=Ktedonosporobacter rubrisoli TaxID=2509675 RepID=A0A4P6JME6_KTERU|nr:YciI family protein [Ktedonosporobacter rubrisoli]QBD76415.1 YciI family protein [Ktedonosporobacter rubrisoli]